MKRILVPILAFGIFFSCSTSDNRTKSAEKIAEMEHIVLTDAHSIKPETADSLVVMYQNFVTENPQDSLSPAYLFRAADILANRKECLKAIDLLDKLVKDYPKSSYAPEASFLKGVIFQDVCLNKEKAEESFNEFIATYPDSPLVNDAKGLLILNKAEDEFELIRQWEEKAEKENQ